MFSTLLNYSTFIYEDSHYFCLDILICSRFDECGTMYDAIVGYTFTVRIKENMDIL